MVHHCISVNNKYLRICPLFNIKVNTYFLSGGMALTG